jgi:hypothetical protein
MKSKRLNDSVVQTRIDRRFTATILKYMLTNVRNHPRTISELVRMSLEDYVYILVENKAVKMVETSEDASAVLEAFFGETAMNPSGRGNYNKFMNLNADDLDRNPKLIFTDPGYGKLVEKELYGKMTVEEFRKAAKPVDLDIDKLLNKPREQPSDEPPVDPNDKYTIRKMTHEEIRAKELAMAEKDRLERELFDQELRKMSSIKNQCISPLNPVG